MRGGSAGRDGSHAGRSVEGARIRGGVHPKVGGLSKVLAVEGAGTMHADRSGSAPSRAKAVAACVTVRAITASLTKPPPRANDGRGGLGATGARPSVRPLASPSV